MCDENSSEVTRLVDHCTDNRIWLLIHKVGHTLVGVKNLTCLRYETCFIALFYVDLSLSEVEHTSSDSSPEVYKLRIGR